MADYVRKAKRYARIVFDGNPENLRDALATEAPTWSTSVYEDSTNGTVLVNFTLGGTVTQVSAYEGSAIYIPRSGGELPEVHTADDEGDAFQLA